MAFASGKSGKLTRKVSPGDTSLYLNTDLGVTTGRLFSKNDTQIEFMNFTGKTAISATEYQYTGLTRQLSQTATPAVSVGTGYTWLANQEFILDYMHDQIFDVANGGTITGNIVFSGDITTTKSMKVPVYADTTARDLGIPTPTNGMEVYITGLGVFQDYVLGAWSNRGTSTGLTLQQILQSYTYGDGSDGNVVISVNSQLTRDMYYQNLTVNASIVLDPNGFKIFVYGTLTLNGEITRTGLAGGASSGATAGVGATALNAGSLGGSVGGVAGAVGYIASNGTGITGNTGNSVNPSYVNITGATGGTSGNGSNSGVSGGPGGTSTRGPLYNTFLDIGKYIANNAFLASYQSLTQYQSSSSGGGGSSGGCGGGSSSGGGGGSAGSGGIVFVAANTLVGAGSLKSLGGIGGIGGIGVFTTSGSGGGGGGGAGGSGGVCILIYKTGTPYTCFMTGGVGGAGGAGSSGGGTAGSTGGSGTTGQQIIINA